MTSRKTTVIRSIDATKPGEDGRVFRVGTFAWQGKRGPRVNTYTRYYNRDWDGCVEFDVLASSGVEAKKAARLARLEMERKQ